MSKPIVKVALAIPGSNYFDYLLPDHLGSVLKPGMRVSVPFGNKKRLGMVMALTEESSCPLSRLKAIDRIIDDSVLLRPKDLKLLEWVSAYYQRGIGETVMASLPGRLRDGKQSAPDRTEPVWQLSQSGRTVDDASLARTPAQMRMIKILREQPAGMAQKQLLQLSVTSRATLAALLKKEWIEPAVAATNASRADNEVQLNAEQQTAVDSVNGTQGFAAWLLYGVTGSGKTEVYIRLIRQALARQAQVLLLAPEIGLTPQLYQRLQKALNAKIVLMHSGLSDGDRHCAWQQARDGQADVLIGTRSCIFTPMPRVGLIIVDEEHDLSYKQQDGIRYSARDLALLRGREADCAVLLGSATPALESLHNVACGRFKLLQLKQRAATAQIPRIETLDISNSSLNEGLSPQLLQAMQQVLQRGEQVLLFHNRRGYAPVLSCKSCDWIMHCEHCDARMTWHKHSQRMWCHHCGTQKRQPHQCPECGASGLQYIGQGTQRIEEFLRQRFAQYALVRIDQDSTRRRGALQAVLQEIKQGKYSLLLGTQMLAKGHHFPNVTLVVIPDMDQALFGADFRATERMAQLLIQVAGRAGRAAKAGRVLIQTRHPDHPLLQQLTREGYSAFAEQALAERKLLQLPPYSHQVLLRSEAAKAEQASEFLKQARECFAATDAISLWGPLPAPMEKRAGRYRYQLILQSTERAELHNRVSAWRQQLYRLASGKRLRWSIDVDPMEMY
ncbi:MAG: primosomal protein N' [gamma proteobacterium symbiont of Bathyaustriella thionipta]|nr:primosomal protein N' [gamma proteobacterium symbiont of Bathyaustriella thionipta]